MIVDPNVERSSPAVLNYDVSLSPPVRSIKLAEEMRARANQPEIQEVIALLERDPVTTAHLLRQVNAPIRAVRQGVSTIDRTVTMLGFAAVANTVFVEAQTEKPEALESSKGRLAYTYLVKSSVLSSFIADALARFLRMEGHDTVRTAALIHQVGRMALLSEDPAAYLPLWKEAVTPDGQPIALPPAIGRELVHFRTDYSRHGEQLAKNWNLPANLAESARYHADPERVEDADRSVILTVAVAQFAARTMFESGDDLERDQSGERMAKATTELAGMFDTSHRKIERFLEDAMRSSFGSADDIEL